VVAQVNCVPAEVGRRLEPELAALETPLEFRDSPIGLDGSKK